MLRSYQIILYAILLTTVQACCDFSLGGDSISSPTPANGIALIDSNDKIIQIRFANSSKILDVNSKQSTLLLSLKNDNTIIYIQTKNSLDTIVLASVKTYEYSNSSCNNLVMNIGNLSIVQSTFDTAYIVHYYAFKNGNTNESYLGDSIYLKLK